MPRLGPWVVYRSEARTLCLEGPLVLTLIGVLQVTQPLPGTTYICFDLLGHNLDMLASRLSSMDLLATLLLRLFSAGRPENEVPLAPLPMSADMVRICAFCLAWPSEGVTSYFQLSAQEEPWNERIEKNTESRVHTIKHKEMPSGKTGVSNYCSEFRKRNACLLG